MEYSYDRVTTAAAEAIADMADRRHDEVALPVEGRRAAGAGVYLLWAHIVGDAALREDDEQIMRMVEAMQ